MTQVIVTINTKTITADLIKDMLSAGASIFRINMSHSSSQEANDSVELIRDISFQEKLTCKIMLDLPGPEVRLCLAHDTKVIHTGQMLKFFFNKKENANYFATTINPELIISEATCYLQDGDITGKVTQITSDFLTIKSSNPGIIRHNCHFSIPGIPLYQNFLSQTDKQIVRDTIELKPDFYALSFVHNNQDVKDFRNFLSDITDNFHPFVLTKFETASSLSNMDEIINSSDYLYIARGDLGTEVSIPALPSIQKLISQRCRNMNKPFFVATQMMESMISHSSPTRAEITDVANAVFEGAQGVTLSAETTIGSYPIHAISWIKRIIEANSKSLAENLKDYIHIPR